MGAIKIPSADLLKKIYGETEESSARFTSLAENFEKKYHHDNAEFFTAPGRTEILLERASAMHGLQARFIFLEDILQASSLQILHIRPSL